MTLQQKDKRALISVSDKTGLIDFARALKGLGFEILSTGGTARFLQEDNINVTHIEEYTNFPEILSGRVKTLHPKIHAGLLHRGKQDAATLQSHDIFSIDLLVVNLYPFAKVTSLPDCTLEEAIENIDIGGPTMIRAAAKNHERVTVVIDPKDYEGIIQTLTEYNQGVSKAERFKLACKAFKHTALYDQRISQYLNANMELTTLEPEDSFPSVFQLDFHKHPTLDLRYGENPHQKAAFYQKRDDSEISIGDALQHQGKPLSYNNLVDADTCSLLANSFEEPCCVIVKHANPCGVAVASTVIEAYHKAYQSDPTSAFGGVIATNAPMTAEAADAILSQQFVEVIIASNYCEKALAVFKSKPNIRVLSFQPHHSTNKASYEFKSIQGGLLIQQKDIYELCGSDLKIATKRHPNKAELADLNFAWQVVKYVKSNAIVYAKDLQTVGIGAGQMSRIFSTQIAQQKAETVNLPIHNSVMASDAFFPFADSVIESAKLGVTAIIQPGGSIRDSEVIDAANEHNIAMIFTGVRHFKH